jgi:membrane fusion protein, multidrug efflux system
VISPTLSRPAALIVAMLALVAGCSRRRAGGPGRVPVTVARAEQRAVPLEIGATGTVEPRQTVSVQSQVTGVLTTVLFHEGDGVARGQALFQIDPRPFQAALDQARAVLARDVAQAANAELDAQRYAELVKQDYVTKQDYDAKRAAAQALTATVRADSAAVLAAALNLGWATIRSPLAGRTGRLLVRPGNLVRANTDQLVVINQIHPILVRFAVPEEQLPAIQRHAGNRLPVLVAPSKADTAPSQGTLTFVDNAVDTATGTVLLKAEFANRDNALWPGEFVNVRLQLYVEPQALVVPAQAVMSGQQGTYLFVVGPDGTARAQSVTVQRTAGTDAVLAPGPVRPGDQVVTDGQLRLVSGAPVEVKGGAGAAQGVEADQ